MSISKTDRQTETYQQYPPLVIPLFTVLAKAGGFCLVGDFFLFLMPAPYHLPHLFEEVI